MDRNSAIGLTLIAILLLAYFYWFAPPPPEPQPIKPADTVAVAANQEPLPATDTVGQQADSVTLLQSVPEELIALETSDIKITFSTKGARIHELELKNYKTYHGEPLMLVQPTHHAVKLSTKYQGADIDLAKISYSASRSIVNDTTVVTFTASLGNGSSFKQVYAVPPTGFSIGYQLSSEGSSSFSDLLTLEWNKMLRPMEKDLFDSRNNTTITYFYNDSFDELSQRSTDTEREVFSGNLKWVSVKQKFFLSAITSEKGFPGGEIETSVNESDTTVVKRANVKVLIPASDLSNGQASYTLYFGPNDYKKIGSVAEDFTKNVYLGWPPVYWINKYVIFPVFYFLTNTIGNFGLIIIILVVLLRIILLPLSYKSYLSMAKMKALKPELDEIKDKFGEDMTKVQQEQMKLYQQAGVNPLSGCIPLVLQMPILFAMFYLFPNTIELRQQSFLWAEDLSTYDSVMSLPFTIPFYGDHVSLFTLLMTVSTLVYTWQNNQISSVQGPMKSMSYFMPVIFLFVLNSFPAGLSFYYFVSNLITFGQQALIKRFVNEDKIKEVMDNHKRMMASGTIKKSKFMAKLEEAMKASEESRKQAENSRKKRRN